MATVPFSDRALEKSLKNRHLERFALLALRKAIGVFSIGIGIRIGELRASDDPLLAAAGRIEEQAITMRAYEDLLDVLAARWDKVPLRGRPFYTPEQRYRILRVRELLALSRSDIASMVRVDPATIGNWEAEATANPDAKTIGVTVRPEPPVRRFADVVRGLVQAMGVAGFGDNDTIAMTLARAGWKISKRTVARIRNEKPVPTTPSPEPEGDGNANESGRPQRSIIATRPNHVRMIDFTVVPGLFRIFMFRVIVAIDVYSRMPLAGKITTDEPSAADAIAVVQRGP